MATEMELTERELINRREALRRVSALFGGVALVGSSAWLAGCTKDKPAGGAAAGGAEFAADEIVFLDEVADTILPTTPSSPGAKAAQVGAFMALMVKDTYDEKNTKIFRDGVRKIDEAAKAAHNVGFVQATPEQRLAILEAIDKEQKDYMDKRESAWKEKEDKRKADSYLPDQRSEGGTATDANPAPELTDKADTKGEDDDPGPHYFRLMKELALLGYFTSEIGYTKAMRYTESPGRFDPCLPYAAGEKSWAPHA